jgi:7,8-dihydroneopterin aldolase/epimerase/oxygenase
MAGTMTIELKQLRFFGHHGLYKEERKTGNEFEVNVSVSYITGPEIITELSSTINYAVLFETVRNRMKQPTDLLETLVMLIGEDIHEKFPQVKEVIVSVLKLHPPINQFTGNVGVTYRKDY